MHTIVNAKEAYLALDTLVNYCHQKGMEFTVNAGNIIESYYDIGFIDRMKPYIMVLGKEMKGEITDNTDFYTTLKFTADGQPGHWKCCICGNRQDFSTICDGCGRKSITLASGTNDYSLIK